MNRIPSSTSNQSPPSIAKSRVDQVGSLLSPQCGFSSNIVGNLVAEDDQWRKLELVQKVAADVWGN